MIVYLDVDYQETGVTVACVGFAGWTDDVATLELGNSRSANVPG